MTQRAIVLGVCCSILSAVVGGCIGSPDEGVDSTGAALTSSTSHLIVPAYFSDTSDSWTTLESGPSALPLGSIVIANYDSGPGWSSALYQHLSTLHSHGVIVLGYVDFAPDYMNNTENNIWDWNYIMGGQLPSYYGPAVMDGIFFDVSARTNDDDIARFEWAEQQVYAKSWATAPSYALFNFGTPDAERNYVDCLSQTAAQATGNALRALFVTRETFEYPDSASGAVGYLYEDWSPTHPAFNWVDSYKPEHFAHIIHDATTDTPTTSTVLQDARSRNAAYVFVTDGKQSSDLIYAQLPSEPLWPDQVTGTNQASNDFGGVASETFTSSCPTPCADNEACWCAHPYCESGSALDSQCSPCVAAVCSGDSYCCATAWDSICLQEVARDCDSAHQCS